MRFNASDPQHAKVNPLRARTDKPHIWFQDGYWRVSPMPIMRRRTGAKANWNKAHNAVHIANYHICLDSGVTHIRWEVM